MVVQPRGALEGVLGERQARAPEGVGGEDVHEALEGYEADVGRVGVEGDAEAEAGAGGVLAWVDGEGMGDAL